MNEFFSFAFRKINSRWNVVKERTQELEDEHVHDQAELNKELIEDQSNRMLSREFVDIWHVLLIQNLDRSKAAAANNNVDEDEMKEAVPDVEHEMTEAARYLLAVNASLVVQCSTGTLTWLDSTTNHKSAYINVVLVNKLVNDNLITTRDEVRFYLRHILIALSYFGEHEQNVSRLLQLTLVLFEGAVNRIGSEETKAAFTEETTLSCGCSAESWNEFETKMIRPSTANKKQVPDKKKKEALKCLLSAVIGVNVVTKTTLIS